MSCAIRPGGVQERSKARPVAVGGSQVLPSGLEEITMFDSLTIAAIVVAVLVAVLVGCCAYPNCPLCSRPEKRE